MFGKFIIASPASWILFGWLLLNAGGIVMSHEEDDEVIEAEPPIGAPVSSATSATGPR